MNQRPGPAGSGLGRARAGSAYPAAGAIHHQLRLVVVRLLRQPKGLLNPQQSLFAPMALGLCPDKPCPRSATADPPTNPEAELSAASPQIGRAHV